MTSYDSTYQMVMDIIRERQKASKWAWMLRKDPPQPEVDWEVALPEPEPAMKQVVDKDDCCDEPAA